MHICDLTRVSIVTGDERPFRPLQAAAEPGQQRGPVQPGGQQAQRRVQAVVGGEIAAAAQRWGRSPLVAAVRRRAGSRGGVRVSGRGVPQTAAARRIPAAAVRGDHTQATEPRPGDRPVARRTAQAHRVAVRERGGAQGHRRQAQSE